MAYKKSKYQFDRIPRGESRFYPVSIAESFKIRKSATYWSLHVAEMGSRLTCNAIIEKGIDGREIWLGMRVTHYLEVI